MALRRKQEKVAVREQNREGPPPDLPDVHVHGVGGDLGRPQRIPNAFSDDSGDDNDNDEANDEANANHGRIVQVRRDQERVAIREQNREGPPPDLAKVIFSLAWVLLLLLLACVGWVGWVWRAFLRAWVSINNVLW